MRRLIALAIVVATAGLPLRAEEATTRSCLVVVDDMHLDFRQTPRNALADVCPDEWMAYVEALRASLRNLAEQTGGRAVFSRSELDAEFAKLAQP